MFKPRFLTVGVLFFVNLTVLCFSVEARRTKILAEEDSELQSVTLTTWELAANPQIFSSYLIANMLSPVLWHMREMMPARSPEGELHSLNRRLKELSSYVQTHVSYPYVKPTRSERDEWGWVPAESISEHLDIRSFEQCMQFFMNLMKKNPEDEDYKPLLASGNFEQGQIPYWRNETADIMWAYRGIRNDDRAVGRCYAYAELIAAALHIVCEIPLEKIYLFGNLEHLVVFVDEGTGYMFSLYAHRDRTNFRRSWSQRFEHKEWWAQFYNNPDFVVNGANFFDSKSGISSIPKAQLEDMYAKLAAFTEGFFEISTPDLSQVEYIKPQANFDLRSCNSQEEAESIIRSLAEENSALEKGLYAYRALDVEHPEAYLQAALRDPHTRERASKVSSLEDVIKIVQKISGRDSIFHSLDRIALPDEAFLFNTASNRERALVLYALIQNSINQNRSQKCSIAFTENSSFVIYGDTIIDAGTGSTIDNISADIIMEFNEYEKEI